MPLQLRPVGSQEPLYSIERDLALIFEQLAGHVPTALKSQNMSSWISNHIAEHHLTEEQLQKAAASFLQGLDNFRDPDIEGVGQAFHASGFWDLPEPCRLAVLASMGLIITNAFYRSIRQLACPADTKPPKIMLATPDVVDAIDAGRAALNHDQRKLDAMAKAKDLMSRRIGG